jgi:hypothetical protein
MSKVRICVELTDLELDAYKEEAERAGIEVTTLVEDVVRRLLRDRTREQEEGTDHDVIVS